MLADSGMAQIPSRIRDKERIINRTGVWGSPKTSYYSYLMVKDLPLKGYNERSYFPAP